ncbi:MAG: O-antigen ligase family protein [Candidatus Omnitrophota bacterium]
MMWIYFFLITLFLRPQDFPGSPFYGYPLNDIIVVGGILSAFIYQSRMKRNIKIPQHNFIIFWILLVFMSNFVNGNMDLGIEQLLAFGKRYIVFLIFLLIANTPKRIRNIFILSGVLAVVLCFQGLYQQQNRIGWAKQTLNSVEISSEEAIKERFLIDEGRTFWIGLWDGPNVLALVYLFVIPFFIINLFRKDRSPMVKISCFLFSCMLCLGIFSTGSRGALLAFMGSMLLFFALRFNKKTCIFLSGATLLGILCLNKGRMALLSSAESSAHERTWLWEQGLSMAQDNPLFGIGKGKFVEVTGLIAHNNFVSSMAEMGYLGVFLYVSIVYLSLKGCLIAYRALRNDVKNEEITTLALIVFTASAAFFMATFFVIMEHDLLFIILALCANVFLIAKEQINENITLLSQKDWVKIIFSFVFVIVLIWLIAVKEII